MGPEVERHQFPQAVLARRMIKRIGAVVTQLLIQWNQREIEEATWEDYYSIAKRFSEFILEVENGVKKGGLSGAGVDLGKKGANLDLVKVTVEEGEALQVGSCEGMLTVLINEGCVLQVGTNATELEMTGEKATRDKGR